MHCVFCSKCHETKEANNYRTQFDLILFSFRFLSSGLLFNHTSCNLFHRVPSQLVHLWTVFEHSGEVPEVPAGELHVPGGEAVADVWGVQGVRLLAFHLPEMKSLLDGYSWPLLVFKTVITLTYI